MNTTSAHGSYLSGFFSVELFVRDDEGAPALEITVFPNVQGDEGMFTLDSKHILAADSVPLHDLALTPADIEALPLEDGWMELSASGFGFSCTDLEETFGVVLALKLLTVLLQALGAEDEGIDLQGRRYRYDGLGNPPDFVLVDHVLIELADRVLFEGIIEANFPG